MSTSTPQRFPLLSGGFFGLTGVALGALGAHRLEPFLTERGMTRAWETGARYHLYHAIALVALAGAIAVASGPAVHRLTWAARCWVAGIFLFSASLYWYALGGPHFLVYVTPIGGLVHLAGWTCVMAAGFQSKSE